MFIFNLIFASLIPVMCLVIGLIVKKRPPRNINWFMGYRTNRSMKNQKTWDYAQERLGRLLRRYSTPVLIISLIPVIVFRNSVEDIQSVILLAATFLQLGAVIAVIPVIEKELKDKFKE